jgi:hypothetical protein
MKAQRIRELLHDLCNKLVAIDLSTQIINPADLPKESQDAYRILQESVEGIKECLYEAHEAIYEVLHKHYPEYKGEPMLVDSKGIQLKMNDHVLVPEPNASDLWGNEFVGTIISTTRGDGVICVRDQDDDCWDVEALRVTRQ